MGLVMSHSSRLCNSRRTSNEIGLTKYWGAIVKIFVSKWHGGRNKTLLFSCSILFSSRIMSHGQSFENSWCPVHGGLAAVWYPSHRHFRRPAVGLDSCWGF